MIHIVRRRKRRARGGTTVVFFAACLVLCFICMAFAMDTGILCLVRTQAQACADAAALAAAWEMVEQEDAGRSSGEIYDAARQTAVTYAGLHNVNGSAFELDDNTDNSPDGEIVIGRLDSPSDRGESMDFSGEEPYNAVQVRISCTPEKQNTVALFFAGIMGINTAGVDAQATAVFDDEHTVGFRVTEKTGKSSLIPFAASVDAWNNFLSTEYNGFEDQWKYDPETQTVFEGFDGKCELKIFPEIKDKSGIVPGNFGTVDIGTAANSTAELCRQIRQGPSDEDLGYHGGEIALDADGTLALGGDTGLSVSIKDALKEIVGQPRTILLYDQVTGQGNTASFRIVGFAGIRVVDFDLTSENKYILIQPTIVADDTAISDDTAADTSYGVGPPVHLVR